MGSTHFDQIADEIRDGDIDRGLWLEALAVSGGDEPAARAQYIKLRARKLRSVGSRERRQGYHPSRRVPRATRLSGPLTILINAADNALADLWTAWLWAWTFTFALLTAVGLLCLGTMFHLGLSDDGMLAWPFLTVGAAFLTCFLFGRGVQQLIVRPPTMLFYIVEILALCAAIWPVSHLMNPTLLGHVPRALNSVLVFLVVRFLNSGDPVANALTVAVFFLPVYGIIAFVRQQKI